MERSLKSQGRVFEQVGGDRSLRIPREVKDAASSWDIGRILSCRRATRGVVNHNFILGTPDGKYVLRQVSHSHHRTPRDLEFELAYLAYLKQSNFPYDVPSAIPTKNHSLFVTVQGHYYWLYRFTAGRVIESLNQSHLAQLAKLMARLHALIVRSDLHNGKPSSDPYNRAETLREIEEYRAEILRKKNADKEERTFLDESAGLTQILRGFNAGAYSHLERYPIHRDLISENAIWNEAS